MRDASLQMRESDPPRRHPVLAWLALRRKALAFSAGLGIVLVGIAMFSLSGSGAKATVAIPREPEQSSAALSSEGFSDVNEQTSSDASSMNVAAPAGTRVESTTNDASADFLESVVAGQKKDEHGSALKSGLGCLKVCEVAARTISKTGDVSISVIAAISEDGTVRQCSVILEESGDTYRIRQIIQPATRSATG